MNNWRNIALSILIMATFVAFSALAVETLYKGPKYEDYFSYLPPQQELADQATCEQNDGKWFTNEDAHFIKPVSQDSSAPASGWCDLHFYANQRWEAANAAHDRNAAIIVGIISAVIFALGWVMTKPVSIAVGFTASGIVLSIFNLVRHSEHMNDYIRLGYVGALFAFAVLLAYRYSKKTQKNNS